MNFLSKLLAVKKAMSGDSVEEKLSLSHTAVTQFLEGKISAQKMLARLMAGFIIVPLAAKPEMEGGEIKCWNPAILATDDGSEWQLVFTNHKANTAFATQNNYLFGLETDAEWVLSKLPPGRGLILNWGTTHQFEWSAEEIRRFRSEITPE